MTDKQIIIDEIDVSECEHFSVYSSNGCCAYFLENEDTVVGCKNYPNCNYKQLKRKEKKLEKIKQYVEDNEWCLLDDTYKELLQIIDGKDNG